MIELGPTQQLKKRWRGVLDLLRVARACTVEHRPVKVNAGLVGTQISSVRVTETSASKALTETVPPTYSVIPSFFHSISLSGSLAICHPTLVMAAWNNRALARAHKVLYIHAAQAMNRDRNRGQMPGLTNTSPGDTKLTGVHNAF